VPAINGAAYSDCFSKVLGTTGAPCDGVSGKMHLRRGEIGSETWAVEFHLFGLRPI